MGRNSKNVKQGGQMTKGTDTEGSREILTDQEIRFITILLEADKESRKLLRGFAKPTKEDQEINAQYNNLIEKVNLLGGNSNE
jgi:hypothetical protein